MVGTASHIPVNHGTSGGSNFADVLSSSYNLSIADYNEPSHSEDRRVETLLGQSSIHDGGNEASYTSGHSHSHAIQHEANVDSVDRRYSNTSITTSSANHSHRPDHHHQDHHQHAMLADADTFPDTFHAEFITQPLEYSLGGASPPLAVSLLSSASAHVPSGTANEGGSRACHPSSFSMGSGNFEEGSHPSESHSHSPPSPSSSPCGPGIPSSPHSPSHILPSFIDTYNLPSSHQPHQHGNITLPSTTILAHRQHAQYSPLTPSSSSSIINGGNRIITSIPRQTTLESRFTMFKSEPNSSPSPQPPLSVGNITFVQSQHSQQSQLVSSPSTSPSPYGSSPHTPNMLSYHPQQQQQQPGQGNMTRGTCNTYEPPTLHFLKKVVTPTSLQ